MTSYGNGPVIRSKKPLVHSKAPIASSLNDSLPSPMPIEEKPRVQKIQTDPETEMVTEPNKPKNNIKNKNRPKKKKIDQNAAHRSTNLPTPADPAGLADLAVHSAAGHLPTGGYRSHADGIYHDDNNHVNTQKKERIMTKTKDLKKEQKAQRMGKAQNEKGEKVEKGEQMVKQQSTNKNYPYGAGTHQDPKVKSNEQHHQQHHQQHQQQQQHRIVASPVHVVPRSRQHLAQPSPSKNFPPGGSGSKQVEPPKPIEEPPKDDEPDEEQYIEMGDCFDALWKRLVEREGGLTKAVLNGSKKVEADDEPKGCETYDYIVVGGGPAGCALARGLSDDSKTSVLLLESGPNFDADVRTISYHQSLVAENDPEMVDQLLTVPQNALM